MAWCEREGIISIFGLAQGPRLKKQIEAHLAQVEKQYQESQAPLACSGVLLFDEDTWGRNAGSLPRRNIWTKERIPAS